MDMKEGLLIQAGMSDFKQSCYKLSLRVRGHIKEENMASRRTLSDIKTVLKGRVRALPKNKGSETLEMFILEKNRVRLEQERVNIAKRLAHIDKEISVIDDELKKLKGRVSQDNYKTTNSADHEKRKYAKKMKKMSIDY